jgi:hypothetical protein
VPCASDALDVIIDDKPTLRTPASHNLLCCTFKLRLRIKFSGISRVFEDSFAIAAILFFARLVAIEEAYQAAR